ncbi:lactococcin 972 family bacteriocin [Cellulosimicrobium cellulans]|jgi:lactococcin 972 family bacteriocin|uniref:Lactococcin 972 family bacteriocin n=1 Tax=Cellulosimicrobium cellulans TaxID=1710 RepID=A0A1Y0HUN5_CELCE|nr:lactococcin 972 family bacteriocin [Cellulosimicrobium cellulans]ARU51789.1 hypothetical protein CBR64_10105 [Cellulosimicrobium cellulans]MBM7818278.1 lactococcin 972 family bacteriocin [Cellulosimicrobium cellulans]
MFGKLRKPVVAVALAVAAVAGGAGTAYATISYVGGGTWDHGVGGGTVWSDYYHGSKCHGSSVQGTYYEKRYASAGRWSMADAPSRAFVVDKAWYDTSC